MPSLPALRALRRPRPRLAGAGLASLLAAVLAAVLAAGCRHAPAAARPPNVVLVVVDAMRGDRVSANGYPLPTTPHIDALVPEGVDFTNAFSNATWTKPSIATLMTSLYPTEHGARVIGTPTADGLLTDTLDDHFVTLAERFHQAGYTTGASVCQVHLRPELGFGQGFDHYVAVRSHDAFAINRMTFDWLKTVGERPFFLYVHYLDPHWPYKERLPDEVGRFGAIALPSKPPRKASLIPDWERGLGAAGLQALVARYDQTIAFVDAGLGELVDHLRQAGLYDDTVLVVTADHGEGFLEHDEALHSFDPYREVQHIPLVFHLPAALRPPVPGKRDALVSLIDLAPTLLDLAGLAKEPQFRGVSFRREIEGQPAPARVVFSETLSSRAVRTPTRSLILHADGRFELYDVDVDPGETHDLAAQCDAECGRLVELVKRFGAYVDAHRALRHETKAAMGAEDLQELKSLGYVD